MSTLGLLLACSGLMGPNVGPHTKQLMDHYAQPGNCHSSTEVPCPPVNAFSANQVATIADWQFDIGEPFLIKGDSELPRIQNSGERRDFRKENILALVIPYRIRNNAPVARKRDVSFQYKDILGETRDYGPYNAEQWGLILDVKSSWDLGKIPPNQWIDTVTVVAADPEGVDGAAIYLRMQETRRYSTGKKYKTTKAQTLIELPPVSRREGPPPWLEVPLDE